jgi:gp021
MYYGEGAGNRRKLIKAKVNQRSKDPSYKKAFDHHVANTDWEKRGKEARSKRGRADAVKGAGKAARGAKNVALGNYRNVGVGILATAVLFKGGQALGVIPANSVIKDRAHAAGQSVYNKVRKTSIDGIRSAARMAAERQRNKDSRSSAGPANFSSQYRDFYDALRDAGIKI